MKDGLVRIAATVKNTLRSSRLWRLRVTALATHGWDVDRPGRAEDVLVASQGGVCPLLWAPSTSTGHSPRMYSTWSMLAY